MFVFPAKEHIQNLTPHLHDKDAVAKLHQLSLAAKG
jgi:hypothetical protein